MLFSISVTHFFASSFLPTYLFFSFFWKIKYQIVFQEKSSRWKKFRFILFQRLIYSVRFSGFVFTVFTTFLCFDLPQSVWIKTILTGIAFFWKNFFFESAVRPCTIVTILFVFQKLLIFHDNPFFLLSSKLYDLHWKNDFFQSFSIIYKMINQFLFGFTNIPLIHLNIHKIIWSQLSWFLNVNILKTMRENIFLSITFLKASRN